MVPTDTWRYLKTLHIAFLPKKRLTANVASAIILFDCPFADIVYIGTVIMRTINKRERE